MLRHHSVTEFLMLDLCRINRAMVIVRPREPFFVWADSLDGQEPRARSLGADFLISAFLIADTEDPKNEIKRHYRSIFEENLLGWCRLADDWPRDRSWAVFQQWFEVQIVDAVFDLADEEPM
jgi:hypothetical protein